MKNLCLAVPLAIGLLFSSGCQKPSPAPATPTLPAVSGSPSTTASGSATPAVQPLFALDLSALSPSDGISLTRDQLGRENLALAFSGQQTKVELPWDINPAVHPQLTLTAWARFTGDPANLQQAQVVSHDNGEFDRSVGLDARAGQWGWSAFAGTAGVIGGAPVNPGQWVFLSVAYDQNASTTVLTVDDAVFSANESQTNDGHPFVWLGGNPSYGEHFVGDIAHVKIFDRLLDADQLQAVRSQ